MKPESGKPESGKHYRVRIPPDLATFLKHLHPRLKTRLRAALEDLERDPWAGKPLQEPLKGLWSYRVAAYRIVYRIQVQQVIIEVIDIAERAVVYQKVQDLLQ